MTKNRVSNVLVVLLCVCGVTSDDRNIESATSPTTPALTHTNTFTMVPTLSTNSSNTTQESHANNGTTVDNKEADPYSGSTDDGVDQSPEEESVSPKYNNTESYSTHGIPSTAMTSGTKETVLERKSSNDVVGIVFLILIMVFIFILGAILYILWKKGRSYSFDLTYHAQDHDTPLRSVEQGGTFEQTIKESSPVLDYGQEEKPQESTPVANGHTIETDPTSEEPEQTALSEQQNVPEEDSFLTDTSLTPPIKKVEFNLDLDLIGRESEVATPSTDDPSESQQNENNNNITNTGNEMDIFTEINLNEPQ